MKAEEAVKVVEVMPRVPESSQVPVIHPRRAAGEPDKPRFVKFPGVARTRRPSVEEVRNWIGY